MRRHLKAAELDKTEPAGGAVGRVKLIDAKLGTVRVAGEVSQEMAKNAINQPWRTIAAVFGKLTKGDFHLVNAVVARLVDARRLACRPEKEAGEQVRQRRMVVPIGHEAA